VSKSHIKKLPKRRKESHKGDFGHVLVVAGSQGMTGAAYLTSQAALLSGSGLVTLSIPESLNAIMEGKLTEVMTLPLPETGDMSLGIRAAGPIVKFSEKADAVAIGPGLSRNKETARLILTLLTEIKKPVIIDADGINALEGKQDVLKRRKGITVLTPHPGEMARLIGKGVDEVQKKREKVAKSVSVQYNCVTILKGYHTVVAGENGEVYVNETGNSGMSTAGMGDVLTGMIASFVGQGVNPFSASVVSVYFHGKAGDIVAREKGQFSLIASDVLGTLPKVFKDSI